MFNFLLAERQLVVVLQSLYRPLRLQAECRKLLERIRKVVATFFCFIIFSIVSNESLDFLAAVRDFRVPKIVEFCLVF